MALITGPTVDAAISAPDNAIAKLVKEQADDAKLVNELYMRILNRPANKMEIEKAIGLLNSIGCDLLKATGWSLRFYRRASSFP